MFGLVVIAILLAGAVSFGALWLLLSGFLGDGFAAVVVCGVFFAVLAGSANLAWKNYQRERARTEQRIAALEKKVEELSKRSQE